MRKLSSAWPEQHLFIGENSIYDNIIKIQTYKIIWANKTIKSII